MVRNSKFHSRKKTATLTSIRHKPHDEDDSHHRDRALLHQLQLHQIELELQNAMLCKAQLELEETRDRYVDLFHFAPIPYITLSDSGRISEANLAAAIMLSTGRVSGLIGSVFSSFIDFDDLERWNSYVRAGWDMPGIHLPAFELF